MMSIVIVAMNSCDQSRSFLDFFGPVRIFGKSRLHWLHHVASSASLRRGGATPWSMLHANASPTLRHSHVFRMTIFILLPSCQCLHFFLGCSMLFIGAAVLCPSLGLGKASAQGRCVSRISFSQRCLLFFLKISFTKGNARNLYLNLRMSVVFQPNDPSSDCVRMTGWKGNPSEASEQLWTSLAARLNDLKGNLLKSNTRWPLWHKDRGASCAGDSGRCILKHQEEVQWSRNVSPRFFTDLRDMPAKRCRNLIGGKHPSIPAWHLLMPGLRLPRRCKWLIVKARSFTAITCYKSISMEFSVKKDWWLLSSFRSICEGRVSVPQSVFSGQPCEHAFDGSSCTSLQEQSEAEKIELLKKLKAEA